MPNPIINRRALSSRRVAVPSLIGNVFSNDYSSGHWTSQGASTTWTYNAGSIGSVGTAGSFLSLIRYNQWYSQSEDFTFSAIYTVNAISATNVFLGVGTTGVSTFSAQPSFWIGVWTNVANNGLVEMYYGNGNLVASQTAFAVAAGNQIYVTVTFSNNGLTMTGTAKNLTTGSSTVTLTYTNTNAYVYGSGAPAVPSIFQAAFNNYKGDYTINSFSFSLNQYNNIDLLLIGDSKIEGYYGGTFPNTIPGLWKSNNASKIIQTSTGSGDVTQDIINCLPEILMMKPKKAILFIGRNDVADGVPDPTWQAHYQTILSGLNSIGCVTYNQVHLIEAAASGFASLIAYVTALSNSIPDPPTWNYTTDNAADGVHPNTVGSLKVYNYQSTIVTI